MRQSFIRFLVHAGVVLILSLFILGPIKAYAQTEQSGSQEGSRAGIEQLLRDLEDPQKLEKLKQDLRLLLQAGEETSVEPAAESSFGGVMLRTMSGYVQDIHHVLAQVGHHLLQIPGLAADLAGKARNPEILGRWAEMGGKVILVLMAGFLAQVLVSRLLSRGRNALKDRKTDSKGFRTLLMFGSTLLELIPIAAFAAAAYGLLPLLDPRPVTQLVALTLVNANVMVRVILAFTRLLLMPETPSLRLLPLDSETVAYVYIWVRRIARIWIYGYFVLEAALIVGLAASLYLFFLKMLGLIIALMVIMVVLQNRAEVAGRLRGDHRLTTAAGPGTGAEMLDPQLRKPERSLLCVNGSPISGMWLPYCSPWVCSAPGLWESRAGSFLWSGQ